MSAAPTGWRFESLTRAHNRSAFTCGVEPLDRYLQHQARQDAQHRAAVPFVLVTEDNRIAGYYTLSAATLPVAKIPPEIVRQQKWPRYPELPATLIGRLASDLSFRGRRVGEMLLLDALWRAYCATTQVASVAVIVDAKDDNASRFYERYGFMSFVDGNNRLFLPMNTIEDLFTG